jgi:arylsulfatase A-like enzyme
MPSCTPVIAWPIIALLLLLLHGCSIPREAEPSRPNVVVILSDDQGWGDVAVHGNKDLETPNLDLLWREGARFEHFYVSPVCSPTRAEFLTGRYHPRGGVYSTSAGGERLDLDEHTIAETFQAAGYATAAFGKWHNGSQYPYHPLARGFDEYYGFPSGHWGHYFSPKLELNGELVRGEGYIVDDLTDHALEFIESHRDQPFFAYLPYNTPHSPMQVPDRFYERFADAEIRMTGQDPDREDVTKTRAALAMCENIDWNVGRILARLEDLDLAENTIVIYFSDNGPNGWRWNGGLRGAKGSTDEGGVRVPFFIRWPGRIPAGMHVTDIAGAIDLLPTLADLAGIPVDADKALDGLSLKPLLLGSTEPWPDRLIFSHWNDRVSVRTPRYRLDHQGRLYDIATDPGQEMNISDANPEIVHSLSAAVDAWKDDVLSELNAEDRPFPVGYSEFPVTHLPARDGIANGGIERSNRFPNDSYFTNWTSTDGRITWDVEVETSGKYEAVVFYTCPEEDVGSTVELSFGPAQVRSVLDQAHDPPLVGAEQDRVPRGESYVKDFKPMRLGVMDLDAGRGTLTLRATDMPGGQVMEVWRVQLTLLEGEEE